ncbi:hypothetical protein P692DRAFT_20741060, partial [Suillus brevipes Sb2]
GVNVFVKLADDSDEVPNIKGKCYADFRLDKKDWEKMKLAHEVLQKSWENMAALPRFSPVHDALQKGLANVAKWYDKTKDTSTYFICLALDPNVKLAYAEHQWDKESFDIGLKSFEQIFDEYYVPTISVSADPNTEQVPAGHGQYGRSWVLAAVQARQVSDRVQAKPRAELTAYFQSPLEQTEDVVGWWGVSFSYHCESVCI